MIVSFTLSNVVQTLWIIGLSIMRHGLVISTGDGYVDVIFLVQLYRLLCMWRWHTIPGGNVCIHMQCYPGMCMYFSQ